MFMRLPSFDRPAFSGISDASSNLSPAAVKTDARKKPTARAFHTNVRRDDAGDIKLAVKKPEKECENITETPSMSSFYPL